MGKIFCLCPTFYPAISTGLFVNLNIKRSYHFLLLLQRVGITACGYAVVVSLTFA
jgi:hypothetical protein